MGNLFNMDGGVLSFLGKVFDVFVLSIIWLLFCLPVFTIGAATTAMYYTTVKVIRRERGYVFKEFWKSFKLNFISATIFTFILFVLGLLFYYNISYAKELTGAIGTILFSLYTMIAFVIFSVGIYIFPVLSRFTMKRTQLIKTSLFMAIKHLPSTIAMELVIVGSVFLVLYMSITALIMPVASCFLISYFMERILKKYMPEQEDSAKDSWYLE